MSTKNTFRFATFKERLDTVTIDIINRSKYNQDEEEVESYFGASLERWTELNGTELFTQFRKQVAPMVWSLKLLLFHKEAVVEKLKSYLSSATGISAAPILDLISNLACDLREDFYPHLAHFMTLISDLLNRHSQDAQTIELVFNCLAQLAYFLHKLMVKDLEATLQLYSPLLASNQKPHIKRFAAESMAFLLRKTPDYSALLDLLLKVIPTPEMIGQLLAEMMRGVSAGRLHSCAQRTVIPLLLGRLSHDDRVVKATEKAISLLTAVEGEAAPVVWASLLSGIQSKSVDREAGLRLVSVLLDSKSSASAADPVQIEQLLIRMGHQEINEDFLNLCSKFIVSADSKFNRFKLVREIFSSGIISSEIIGLKLNFATSLLSTDYFERDVLVNVSNLISHVITSLPSEIPKSVDDPRCSLLHFMTSVIIDRCPESNEPIKSKDAGLSSGFTFVFHNSESVVADFLLDVIHHNSSSSKPGAYFILLQWMAVTCLPFVRPLSEEKCRKVLNKFLQQLISNLVHDNASISRILLLTLATLLDSCARFLDLSEGLDKLLTQNTFPALISKYKQQNDMFVLVLRSLDIYLTKRESDKPVTMDTEWFISSLISFKHKIRLHCLRILEHLERPHSSLQTANEESTNEKSTPCSRTLSRCLLAERVPLTVQTYRDIIMHMEHLKAERDDLAASEMSKQIALSELLGLLHSRFAIIWKPMYQVIASYSSDLAQPEIVFWPKFLALLSTVTQRAEEPIDSSHDSPAIHPNNSPEVLITMMAERLSERKNEVSSSSPDWMIYRDNLWQVLLLCPDQTGRKTKTLSPLFLQFIEKEFNADGPQTKAKKKTLITMLDVYSKLSNIRSISNEKDLNKWFHKFLCHRHVGIQKAAFNCIAAYRKPELVPYREHFDRILNEVTFKDEMRSFRLDQTVVKKDHRTHVAKIMLRLLYGRLQTKDKSSCDVIFTYLSACDSAELDFSIHLLFEPFLLLMGDSDARGGVSLLESLERTQEIYEQGGQEIVSSLALGKMQAVCKTIEAFLSYLCYHLTTDQMSQLLRLSLTFCAVCVGVKTAYITMTTEESTMEDDEVDAVAPSTRFNRVRLSQLKTLRQACHSLIIHFFGLEKLIWNTDELNSVQLVSIAPYLRLLSQESLNNPGIVVRLSLIWSSNRRYVSQLEGKLLAALIDLLDQPKVHRSVAEAIVQICHNLLYLEDIQEVGITLLTPHISILIDYLGRRVEQMQTARSAANQRELELVTSCVTQELLTGANQCSVLLGGLLGCLSAVHRGKRRVRASGARLSEELECALMRAVNALFVKSSNVEQHFKRFLPLFSKVSHRASRSIMCDVVHTSWHRLVDDGLGGSYDAQVIPRIVKRLNSWDSRRIEEPDYSLREKGFKEVTSLLDVCPLNQLSSGVPFPPELYLHLAVANNAVWNLLSAEDTGLRRLSLNYLISLVNWVAKDVPRLANRKAAGDDGPLANVATKALILDTMWKAVKDGVTQSESRRLEFLELMGVIVKRFHRHPEFSGLAKLAEHDESNLEGDFFENIKSLINARNAQALRRLKSLLNSHTLPSHQLRSPILPLVLHYLSHTGHHSNAAPSDLVLAALDALTAVCGRLCPAHYRDFLKVSLYRLDKGAGDTEMNIRSIVAALESFTVAESEKPQEEQTELIHVPMDMSEPLLDTVEVEKEEIVESEEEESDTEEMDSTLQGGVGTTASTDLATSKYLMDVVYPKLEKHLSKKRASEDRHKWAQKSGPSNSADEGPSNSEKLQVPVALAMVKLLKKLPRRYMDQRLPRIVYRVIDFLKSRDQEVRTEAGTTLTRLLSILGTRYLNFIVSILTGQLSRGYQRHVALHTVHHVLKALEKEGVFTTGDFDNCGQQIIKLYLDEIVGSIAKEKEDREEKKLPPEAKKVKAYEGIQRLSRHISVTRLRDFFQTLQEESMKLRSQKFLKRMEKVFEQLQTKEGLPGNASLDNKALLIVAQALATEHLTSITATEAEKARASQPLKKDEIVKEDCLLLEEEPTRDGKIPVEMPRTNAHLLVDCGIQILFGLLKRDRLSPQKLEDLQMLDPFVPIIFDTIKQKYVKTVTSGVRCLLRLLSFPLPAFKTNISSIAHQLFKLIAEHAKTQATVSRGNQANQELAAVLFKTIAALIRDCKVFQITRVQLALVLDVIDLDLSKESGRTATAFSLLKAVLSRRLKDPGRESEETSTREAGHKRKADDLELASRGLTPTTITTKDQEQQRSRLSIILRRLRSLSIQSPSEQIREQARHCLLTHLLEYPHKTSQLEEFIAFFLRQLQFSLAEGRLSANEMLSALVRKLPIHRLTAGNLEVVILMEVASALERESIPLVRVALLRLFKALFEVLPSDLALQHYREYLLAFLKQSKRPGACLLSLQLIPAVLGCQDCLSWSQRGEEVIELVGGTLARKLEESEQLEAVVEATAVTKGDHLLQEEMMEEEEDKEEMEEDIGESKTPSNSKAPPSSHQKLQIIDGTILHSLRLFRQALDQSESANETDQSIFLTPTLSHVTTPIWQLVESRLLTHGYLRVREEAANCLRSLLKSIVDLSDGGKIEHPYLAENFSQRLRLLSRACIEQLKTEDLNEDWCQIVVLNLVYLCQLTHKYMDQVSEGEKREVSIAWIIARLNQVSLEELNHSPMEIMRRSATLKLCSALCLRLPSEVVTSQRSLIDRILVIFARENRQLARLRQPAATRKALPGLVDTLAELVESLESALVRLITQAGLAEGLGRVEKGRRTRADRQRENKDAKPVLDPESNAIKKRRKNTEAIEKKKIKKRRIDKPSKA